MFRTYVPVQGFDEGSFCRTVRALPWLVVAVVPVHVVHKTSEPPALLAAEDKDEDGGDDDYDGCLLQKIIMKMMVMIMPTKMIDHHNGDNLFHLHNLQTLNLRLFSAIFLFVLSLRVFFSLWRSSGTCARWV